jgi:hypothetical protein
MVLYGACRKEEPSQQNVAFAAPTRTPLPPLDNCLVGTWEAETITPIGADSPYKGGTGFHLTFKEDGTQVADYSSMKPLKSESIVLVYQGSAEGG